MARTLTFQQAINEALDQEMARDESVIVMGEDVAGGQGAEGEMDAWGGVLGVTKGLYAKYGDRVMDTPISESAFIGAAIGAATSGLRPVVELMFNDFMGVCFDQIFNQAAKFRYMFGGKAETPVVIRTMIGDPAAMVRRPLGRAGRPRLPPRRRRRSHGRQGEPRAIRIRVLAPRCFPRRSTISKMWLPRSRCLRRQRSRVDSRSWPG